MIRAIGLLALYSSRRTASAFPPHQGVPPAGNFAGGRAAGGPRPGIRRRLIFALQARLPRRGLYYLPVLPCVIFFGLIFLGLDKGPLLAPVLSLWLTFSTVSSTSLPFSSTMTRTTR